MNLVPCPFSCSGRKCRWRCGCCLVRSCSCCSSPARTSPTCCSRAAWRGRAESPFGLRSAPLEDGYCSNCSPRACYWPWRRASSESAPRPPLFVFSPRMEPTAFLASRKSGGSVRVSLHHRPRAPRYRRVRAGACRLALGTSSSGLGRQSTLGGGSVRLSRAIVILGLRSVRSCCAARDCSAAVCYGFRKSIRAFGRSAC